MRPVKRMNTLSRPGTLRAGIEPLHLTSTAYESKMKTPLLSTQSKSPDYTQTVDYPPEDDSKLGIVDDDVQSPPTSSSLFFGTGEDDPNESDVSDDPRYHVVSDHEYFPTHKSSDSGGGGEDIRGDVPLYELPDEGLGEKCFSWDYCMVFAMGKKGKERRRFQKKTALILDSMRDAGLEITIYRADCQHKYQTEIFCLIGATEHRLKDEADRIKCELALDPERALQIAYQNGSRLAERTMQGDAETDKTPLDGNIWRHLYARYDKRKRDRRTQEIYRRYNPLETGDGPPMSLFRNVDRIKLINSIVKGPTRAGGAGQAPLKLIYLKDEPVLAFFPLHGDSEKEELLRKWQPRGWEFSQPLDTIRDYFGESIGLYFAFLGYYCKWLFFPLLPGAVFFIFQVLLGSVSVPGIFVLGFGIAVWSTMLSSYWKREQSKLRVRWGQTNFQEKEKPRPEFTGNLVYSDINGQEVVHFKPIKRTLRQTWSSSVLFSVIAVVIAAVAGIFVLRSSLRGQYGNYIVGVINAVQIAVLDVVYTYVANILNEWENHPTDTTFENALIAKLFAFKFVNSYITLFYIAFLKRYAEGCGPDLVMDSNKECLAELQIQLGTVFASIIVINNIFEILIPKLTNWWNRTFDVRITSSRAVTQAEREYARDTYFTTLDDYSELIFQFGFVTLFFIAFPLTPLLAIANNWLEVRIDSHKICHLYRRAEPRGASDIGTWQAALNILIFAAVVTNIAFIVFLTNELDGQVITLPKSTSTTIKVWVFVILEHLLLGLKFFIEYAISADTSQNKRHILRQEYVCHILVEHMREDLDDAHFGKEYVIDNAGQEPIDYSKVKIGLAPTPHNKKRKGAHK